jgi:hypothetical protein
MEAGLPDFSIHSTPKRVKSYQIAAKLSNGQKMYQNGCDLIQMAKYYTNLFHSKTLQNLPKSRFLV